MDKFTTNQFAEDTTAAEIYEMREEHRRAESAKPFKVWEQFGMTVEEWNASQSAWDVLHDMHGLRGF